MPVHNIPPVYDKNSRILILGSFPSVRSRADEFFYAHPRNRFWQVISAVYECPLPCSVQDKKQLLLGNNIALWDVIARCSVTGSSDMSIKNAEPNDIGVIIRDANIQKIILNGKTAEKYYNRLVFPSTGIRCECLPSTSPANAAIKTEELIKIWKNSLLNS
ncbi:MAG: DNA-deoxyinosine glycosylase [Oscillospiraceae bacterium]|nr:DNA-deoxyinosine glycosylase [Oscillospiraceae bacterium]